MTGQETSINHPTGRITTKNGKLLSLEYDQSINQTSLVDDNGNIIWTNVYTFTNKPRDVLENCIILGDFVLLRDLKQNLLVDIADGSIKCTITDDLFYTFSGHGKKMTTHDNLIYSSYINVWCNEPDGTTVQSAFIPVFEGQKILIDDTKPPDEFTVFDIKKCKTIKPGLVTECLLTYPEGMVYYASGKPVWKREWAQHAISKAVIDFWKQLACPFVNLSTDLVLVWYQWGRIEALDRRNGSLVWFRDINKEKAKCTGERNILKVRYKETIDHNKDLYITRHLRLDARTGKEIASWTEKTDSRGNPIHIYSKFNEATGNVVWQIELKEEMKQIVQVNQVNAILTRNASGDWEPDFLYGVDDKSGRILWKIRYTSTSFH